MCIRDSPESLKSPSEKYSDRDPLQHADYGTYTAGTCKHHRNIPGTDFLLRFAPACSAAPFHLIRVSGIIFVTSARKIFSSHAGKNILRRTVSAWGQNPAPLNKYNSSSPCLTAQCRLPALCNYILSARTPCFIITVLLMKSSLKRCAIMIRQTLPAC